MLNDQSVVLKIRSPVKSLELPSSGQVYSLWEWRFQGRISPLCGATALPDFRTHRQKAESMTVLHLICGLPGAGKTTLARQLENGLPALRLAPDEWMSRISGDGCEEEKRAAIEGVQWDIAGRGAGRQSKSALP
jgi:AAA domain